LNQPLKSPDTLAGQKSSENRSEICRFSLETDLFLLGFYINRGREFSLETDLFLLGFYINRGRDYSI